MTEELNPHSKISAYFNFRGDFDPDLLTQTIGIEPTKISRKGEQNLQFKVPHLRTFSSWSLYSDMSQDQDIEAHTDDLIKKLETSWSSFVDLSQQYRASLVCIIFTYDSDRPYIGLAPETIKKLSVLNASFDVDLYTGHKSEKINNSG